MSRQIALERVTRELFDLFDETFEHHHGIFLDEGTSLLPTLDGVSAAEASRAAAAGSGTIAAHARHVAFYLGVLEKVVRHEPVGKVDWGEIWRTTREVSPAEWDEIRRELGAARERVLGTLKGLETWEGEDEFAGALAMLVHTACHLGAIRQALAAIRDPAPHRAPSP